MITEEQQKTWEDISDRVFNVINDLGEKFKDHPEIRAACLTEIVMPMYDYLIKVGGVDLFNKIYTIYKLQTEDKKGDLNS